MLSFPVLKIFEIFSEPFTIRNWERQAIGRDTRATNNIEGEKTSAVAPSLSLKIQRADQKRGVPGKEGGRARRRAGVDTRRARCGGRARAAVVERRALVNIDQKRQKRVEK